ncbi:acidic fibroblast growth factor intracellular-binding protein-like [Apostichopus japonicus]|uniref:acidic fibroblast growth factor intracellular-binding protein-like n=1 Tax=Stichopus japonicus TaxID=307972 RepID=UPI003AB22E43
MDGGLSVFVGNTIIMDPECYKLWLDGFTYWEAANKRFQRFTEAKGTIKIEVIKSDTVDNYRMFMAMEKHLRNPTLLEHQAQLQIPTNLRRIYIEQYYELDPVFARQILGKKLSSRNRKDLDDISESTNIKLRSCRRQYDNFKRVFKTVEDMQGPIVKNIQKNFLISEPLARKYAAIVFFANNRFETSKKKLQYLTFDDFCYCADRMIDNWTIGSNDPRTEDLDADFDRQFLQELRELKFLANDKDASDQHKSLMFNSLKGQQSPGITINVENNFKNLSRAIISIAVDMIHSKDLKDFFIDVVEKITEPCKQAHWSSEQMSQFLKLYTSCSARVEGFQRNPKYHSILARFMSTLIECVQRMYHT